jgi:hypothetical protein
MAYNDDIYGTNRNNNSKKDSSNDLGLAGMILFAGAKGDLDIEEAHSMLGILQNNEPILRAVPSEEDKSLGKSRIYKTLDIAGNPLIAGENYIYQGKKIKVLREQFGAGNILDTYMRVFYLNTDLKEDCTIVDAKYRKGIFNGARYESDFEPIVSEDTK